MRENTWSFNDDFAKNVIIFGVDNSPSSHPDNLENDFLILREGDAFGINGSFGAPEKNNNINFGEIKTKLCLILCYNSDNSYLFVKRKKIYKFKASNKNVNIPSNFFLGSMSNKFDNVNSEKVSLKGNVYDLSVDYNTIDNSDILNIRKNLMTKHNIK